MLQVSAVFAVLASSILALSGGLTLNYEDLRNTIIDTEDQLAVGGEIELTRDELVANEILIHAKDAEFDEGTSHPERFLAAKHFFLARDGINQSPVYDFVKKMPKGAILHGHNTAMVPSAWIVSNITYRDGLLMCITSDNVLILGFRTWSGCTGGYRPVAEARAEAARAASVEEFDRWLDSNLNLWVDDPNVAYPNINVVWQKFQNQFSTISDLVNYRPVYEDFHYKLLETLYEDGVTYTEIRTSLGTVYELDGTEYYGAQVANLLKGVIDKFKQDHPGFFGAKVIYAIGRSATPTSVGQRIETFRTIRNAVPNFLIGFDLVGQEDLGRPLLDFIEQLHAAKEDVSFFFHAGETNWYGTETDWNLADAFLLNTTRIGHGYAINKHPLISKLVRDQGIALEISPISNQVLALVRDLRNHPAATLIAEGAPMVISSDDPGFWGAAALSHDFYYALMAFTSATSDLRVLKQLVWNSIIYSGLKGTEKEAAFVHLNDQWKQFILSYPKTQSAATLDAIISKLSNEQLEDARANLLEDIKNIRANIQ